MNPSRLPRPALAALVIAACASAGPRAGTGDVAFRLLWEGPVDLDLHVEDPSGDELSFVVRESESGGLLDVDCNSKPEAICRQPIENVFWPPGAAPEGLYRYWVELFQPVAGVDSAEYTLQVLRGTEVVETRQGTLTLEARQGGPFDYRFERQPVAVERPVPPPGG